MIGLTPQTEKIFEKISLLECVKDYILMGGTALALQLNHRQSEDLDFCRWHKTKKEHLKVDWHIIQQQLSTIGETTIAMLDHTQCDFLVEGVRITFLDDNKFKQPEGLQKVPYLRTRDMLSLLLNASKPPLDANFSAMSPIYDLSFEEIKQYLVEKAKELVKN